MHRTAIDAARRLTFLMFFRVVVTTLLLGVAIIAEAAAPAPSASPTARVLFAATATIYGLTILWALILRRVRSKVGSLRILAQVQIGLDLPISALLVHFTGGAESGLVFLFLLAIVGGSTVLSPRGARLVAIATALLYVAVTLGGRAGVLPDLPGGESLVGPLGPTLRAVALHLVFFGAISALSTKLATELHRAGERIAAQGTRLEDLAALHANVVRSLASGLITVDDSGRVRSINPAGVEIFGTNAEAILGEPADRLSPALADLLRSSAPPGGTPALAMRRAEVVVDRADRERRIVGLSVSPLYNSVGESIGRVVSFQDLTELRRMQEQVERATRLAAIGRLAAGIAHEIRNPLAAISGSIELLRAQGTSPAGDGGELWEIIGREVDRLDGLITDLLDFARPRSPQPIPLELGATLIEMVRIFENDKRLVGGRVEIYRDGPLWVEADLGQLRQVVWNLLRNAAEASPEGRPIVVAAVNGSDREGDWAAISVRDHGSGIAANDRGRLFEPFFTTKRGGTGLGLATVHRIVDEHGGKVELDNAEGGGAIATVWLPRVRPEG